MAELNILRPLTVDEKKEMVEVGTTDLIDKFLSELAKKKAFYQKRYRLLDSYAARMDFEEDVRHKVEKKHAAIDKKTADTIINFDDLDKYAEAARFLFTGKKEIIEDKLLDGIRQPIKIGTTFLFKAKERGNRLSMFAPNEDEARVGEWVENNIEKDEAYVKDLQSLEEEDDIVSSKKEAEALDTSAKDTKKVKK